MSWTEFIEEHTGKTPFLYVDSSQDHERKKAGRKNDEDIEEET